MSHPGVSLSTNSPSARCAQPFCCEQGSLSFLFLARPIPVLIIAQEVPADARPPHPRCPLYPSWSAKFGVRLYNRTGPGASAGLSALRLPRGG